MRRFQRFQRLKSDRNSSVMKNNGIATAA